MDHKRPISHAFSLYLDLFRVVAALIVVGAHATMPVISGAHYAFPFGEDAVLGFFVLSGFVISSVADGRENNFRVFAIARLSRLWSVLIPALLIGPLLVHLGFHFWHNGFRATEQGSLFSLELPRSVASAIFSNEIWFLSLTPDFNAPLWSISFEFWYYVIFAAYIFGSKRYRWAAVAVAAAIAGPQILLLMPGWLLGAVLYKNRDRISLNNYGALVFFIVPIALILIGHALHAAPFLQSLYLPVLGARFVYGDIFFARDFVWQNFVGVMLAAHLAGAYVLFKGARDAPKVLTQTIRYAAGLTYSVYLLHFPAQLVIVDRLHQWPNTALKVAVVMAGSIAISALFGAFLEPTKTPFRNWMLRLTDRSARSIPVIAPAS